jgi:hypothetical protein
MKINYNSKHSNKSIIIPPKTDPLYHKLHHLQNISKWKDQRLELVEIPKGLIEVLQDAGLTVEKILNDEPSNIAEKLGIDSYVGEIIFKETKKAVSKMNLNLLIN